MIVSSDYRAPIPNSSKATSIYVPRQRYSNLDCRSANQYAPNLSTEQSDLIIDASNISSLPSASDLELGETERDLLVAQKSHLEYLSGTGRPFDDFLAELRREEDCGEVSG
jgi:hypothetical protein